MSKVEVDLKRFLISGQFGPITLELSRSQVMKLIGWPDAWLPEPKLMADLWAYDWIEFYFTPEGKLYLIRSDHIDTFEDNQRFNFHTWILNPRLTLGETETTLLAENIPFQKTKHPRYEISYLTLQSGVELSFEPDEDQPAAPYLVAFHCRNVDFPNTQS